MDEETTSPVPMMTNISQNQAHKRNNQTTYQENMTTLEEIIITASPNEPISVPVTYISCYQPRKLVLRDPTQSIQPSELIQTDQDPSQFIIRYTPAIPGMFWAEILFDEGGLEIPINTVLHVTDHKDQKNKQTDQKDKDMMILYGNDPGVVVLDTPVHPLSANHSYNGIMFDIRAKGPEDVDILGFTVGGTLGDTTIYVSAGSWEKEYKTETGWSKVMSRDITAQNETQLTFLSLSIPIRIRAEDRRGFYIHCAMYHDGCLFYQSYKSSEQAITQDKRIAVYPGQARCGAAPFGVRGRWRKIRGLSGSVVYHTVKKIWTPKTHHSFPPSFCKIVMVLLMLWYREDSIFSQLPQEAIFEIVQCMEWDWFEVDPERLILSEPSNDATDFWGRLDYPFI